MRTIGGSATLTAGAPFWPAVGNYRTGRDELTTHDWNRPFTPSSSSPCSKTFGSSSLHPASVGLAKGRIRVHERADVSACHPASPYFRSDSTSPTLFPRRPSPPTVRTLASYKPLVPSKPNTLFDSATTHPASVSTSTQTACGLSVYDRSDPAVTHPASAVFVSAPAVFDASTTHPASVSSARIPVPVAEDAPSNSSFTHPASSAFRQGPFDPCICHPASVGIMSLQQQQLPSDYQSQQQQLLRSTITQKPSSSIHPASISTRLSPSYGPSDARHVHPASASFVTFNSATTHPASVWRPGQGVDMGDTSVSHPGWIGFGAAKPPKARL